MPGALRPLELDRVLRRLGRDEARAGSALAEATRQERADEARAHASALVRAPIELTRLDAALGDGTRDDDVTLHVEDGERRLTLAIEGRSAMALAARVLGVEAPALSTGDVGDRARGALAALALAVLRRMGATPRPFRLADAGPAGARLTVTAQALVGSEPVELRVVAPASPGERRRADPRTLGGVPLTLGLSLAAGIALTRREVAALGPGRALLLGRTPLSARELALTSARSERGARVALDGSLGGARRAVLTGDAVESPLAMDPDSSSPLDEALREAELVVRVELASVTLPVASWAALREGDVVTTDAPVGSLVRLRAGGVAFAEGELCDLDGHLAVRITRRAPPHHEP